MQLTTTTQAPVKKDYTAPVLFNLNSVGKHTHASSGGSYQDVWGGFGTTNPGTLTPTGS